MSKNQIKVSRINQALPSLPGGTLEIILTFSLKGVFAKNEIA